jgi:hypothetical protein
MSYFFVCHEVFEVMNSHACVCGLNNLLLIVIMINIILIVILKKETHNSLIFNYLTHKLRLTYLFN